MRGTILFLLMIAGFFTLVVPAWADSVPGAGAPPPQNVSLLPDPGLDAGLVSPVLPPEAVIPAGGLSTDDFIDTIPLFSVALPVAMHVELMVEESVVGLDSVDGIGVMFSW